MERHSARAAAPALPALTPRPPAAQTARSARRSGRRAAPSHDPAEAERARLAIAELRKGLRAVRLSEQQAWRGKSRLLRAQRGASSSGLEEPPRGLAAQVLQQNERMLHLAQELREAHFLRGMCAVAMAASLTRSWAHSGA